jgi:hypothetical protein
MPDRVEQYPQFLSVGIASDGTAVIFDGLNRQEFEIKDTTALRKYFGINGEDPKQIISEAIRVKRNEE